MTPRDEFYSDIIITALEGGIGYWAQASHYQYVLDDATFLYCGDDIRPGGTLATIHEMNEDGDGYSDTPLEVTPDVIRDGIDRLKQSPRFGAEMAHIDREMDAGEVDADLADNIVQWGLLGECRYA